MITIKKAGLRSDVLANKYKAVLRCVEACTDGHHVDGSAKIDYYYEGVRICTYFTLEGTLDEPLLTRTFPNSYFRIDGARVTDGVERITHQSAHAATTGLRPPRGLLYQIVEDLREGRFEDCNAILYSDDVKLAV